MRLHHIRTLAGFLALVIGLSACGAGGGSGGGSASGGKPLRVDLPIDLKTGEIDDKVWKRWLAWDPVRMMDQERSRKAAKKLELVFVDCGTKDEFNLDLGARMLVEQLKKAGAKVVHEEFDDGHMDIPYRYDRSFEALSKVL